MTRSVPTPDTAVLAADSSKKANKLAEALAVFPGLRFVAFSPAIFDAQRRKNDRPAPIGRARKPTDS
jgi:hypothetical protein